MQVRSGFASDIGRKRSQNQDAVACLPEQGIFLVADGMGGHRGGETASQMAVETIVESLSASPSSPMPDRIRTALRDANQAIFKRSLADSGLQGMGTTTTLLVVEDRVAWIGHVGDSRCYLLRPRQIWQLTRDHSLVQEKLRAGLITRDEVKTDRMKNVITRSVGFEPEVAIEVYEIKTNPGDTFLICSDGLSGAIDEKGILDAVQSKVFQAPSPGDHLQEAVNSLIASANQTGGDDNISVVVVQIEPAQGDPS